ncbi:MAG: hypothetical protein EOO14_25495 [Chitinophagaceae bacterium]|nr:MAG: hypothetical protein EOO14_25495 [Chitinophagaceae bacterium]
MRSFLCLAFWLLLFFPQQLPAQPIDSLAQAIDSNANAINRSATEIQRWKDSLQKEKIFRNLADNGQSLDTFLQEMREKEDAKKRQVNIRIGLGVLFLIAVVVGFLRRRR